ncbi:hypothetical protein SAMN04515656_1377 [Eubacterium aggregans]|uniref:Zinc-ribbon domain-containing protein n=1 Tax=Eubacterium aggregans TaxID=81409 RepID=A0A1H4ECC8_9FIRM|nr:zinc ribbon domain-containing protein [Eubacterium aggregans]SEA82606.1 hypothetical protein SAMN04515656_1377 [Eubacterium aggregans]
MGNYCTNCGKELHTGACFCAKCGAAVLDAPAKPVPVAQPKPVPQSRPTAEAQPQKRTPPAATPKRKSAAAPKRNDGRNTLCIVLSVLLVIQLAAVALYGWPGFMVKGRDGSDPAAETSDVFENSVPAGLSNIQLTREDYAVEPWIVNVGPNQTVAQAEGIGVDFGEFNLLEDGALEIRDMGVKADGENGYSARCYDLSLGDATEFPTYVTVTLPYEPTADSAGGPFVQYYNNGAWEMMYSVRDESAGTVTFYTDHFSTFGLFEHTGGYNSGPLSKVKIDPNKLDLLINNCESDSAAYFAMMRSGSPEDSGLIKAALDAFGATSNILSGADYSVSFTEKALEKGSAFTNEFSNALGKVGAGLTALKVGMSWYRTGEVTQAFTENKYDIIELGLGSAGTALGAAPLTVAASGVWLMGMADQTITDIYNQGYDSPAEHAYQEFTWEYVAYSNTLGGLCCRKPTKMPARALLDEEMSDAVIVNDAKIWARLIEREYKKYRSDPQKMYAAIDKMLDDYANTFWRLKANVRKMIAEDIHRADAWSEPTAQERAKLTEELKAVLRYRLRKLFACVFERCILDAKQQLLRDILALEKQMNAVTTVKVCGRDEKGNEIPLSETEYRGYTAAFAPSATERPTIWIWLPGSAEDSVFQCTLYNYLSLGAPTCVKFYKTWEDQVADNTAFALPLTYAPGEVKLFVDTELSIDELVGTYEGTVSSEEGSLSHTFTVRKNGDGIMIDDTMDTVKLQYDPATGIARGSMSTSYGEYKLRYTYRFTFARNNGTIFMTGTSSAYLDDEYQSTANFNCYKVS